MSLCTVWIYCISHVRVTFLCVRSYLPCKYVLCIDFNHWSFCYSFEINVKNYFIGFYHNLFLISLVAIFSMLISDSLFISKGSHIGDCFDKYLFSWTLLPHTDCK